MLYKNLNFAGNRSKQYSAVRESVAATYSSVQAYSSGMRNFYINMRTILLLGEPNWASQSHINTLLQMLLKFFFFFLHSSHA